MIVEGISVLLLHQTGCPNILKCNLSDLKKLNLNRFFFLYSFLNGLSFDSLLCFFDVLATIITISNCKGIKINPILILHLTIKLKLFVCVLLIPASIVYLVDSLLFVYFNI